MFLHVNGRDASCGLRSRCHLDHVIGDCYVQLFHDKCSPKGMYAASAL